MEDIESYKKSMNEAKIRLINTSNKKLWGL